MAKVKVGEWEVEEEELERQHKAAKRRGKETARSEVQAKTVHYDAFTNRVVIELKNGAIFQLPRSLVQGLSDAPSEELAQVRLGPRGASLHWDTLDVDLSISGLLMGVFGTRSWMAALGQKGGRVKSVSKAAAARQNGKKGGRPASNGRGRKDFAQPV
jgi:hypothetical protein